MPMDEQVWLNDLNPQQREAVTHVDGPLLVDAGAGSGKTRTLAYRVSYLISRDYPKNRGLRDSMLIFAGTHLRLTTS